MKADELRSLQAPLKERYRSQPDAAPVGFRQIRLHFDLDTDASEEQLTTLLRLTERYCVVYQSLRQSPEMTVSRRAAHR